MWRADAPWSTAQIAKTLLNAAEYFRLLNALVWRMATAFTPIGERCCRNRSIKSAKRAVSGSALLLSMRFVEISSGVSQPLSSTTATLILAGPR
ncbi:Uncharacterised protein [Mycobacteroides abscessus subsp. abscessus]|nr:Uncharacterised protein [Mycobacteroides abscessus subsp. abscessus]